MYTEFIYIYYTIRIICVDYIMCLVPKIGDPQVKMFMSGHGRNLPYRTSQTDVLEVIPNGAKKNQGPGLANAKGERPLFCFFPFMNLLTGYDKIWLSNHFILWTFLGQITGTQCFNKTNNSIK